MLYLLEPKVELETEYRAMIQEWKDSGEPLVPWFLALESADFPHFILKLLEAGKGLNLPEGFVPHSAYWLINENNRILGAVSLRHHLNEKLLILGGHIGFGIRPSERCKGYATTLLHLTLKKAKALNISQVLLTCDKINIASAKTIIKNGGVLENELVNPDRITQRYWITLASEAQ